MPTFLSCQTLPQRSNSAAGSMFGERFFRPSASSGPIEYNFDRPHPNQSSIESILYNREPRNVNHDVDKIASYREFLEKQIRERGRKSPKNATSEERFSNTFPSTAYRSRSVELRAASASRKCHLSITSPKLEPEAYDKKRLKQTQYCYELTMQIAEKERMRRKKLEEEMREAELLALRLEEQNLRQQQMYEEEEARRHRKEEELRLKRERLAELQASRVREEEERRRREEEERRRKEEEERRLRENQARSVPPPMLSDHRSSPPVPSVRTHQPAPIPTPRDPVAEMRRRFVVLPNAEYDATTHRYKVMNRRAVHEDDSDNDDEFQDEQL